MKARQILESAEGAEKLVDRLLAESPRDIPATSFGMEDPARQAALTSKLDHDHRTHEIDRFQGLALLKAGMTIFAKDELGLCYFVKWIDEKYAAIPGRHVTQIAVWVRGGAPAGIPRHVFWNHLFPIHGTMMTDLMQTTDGKRFWFGRIKEALDRSLLVYRVNLVQHGQHDPIQSMQEYQRWTSAVYGDQARHEQERLVITDRPLSRITTVKP